MAEGHDVDICARKHMSRRFFFGVLGGAVAAVAIAPAISKTGWEAWTEGGHIFYRPILTNQQITIEMLKVLQDNLVDGKKVTRTWDKQFPKFGCKIGNAITVRKPLHFFMGQEASWPA